MSIADRFPGSAVILYESGTLAEAMATDFALAGAKAVMSPGHGLTFPLGSILERRTKYLNNAASWLGQAAVVDPHNDMLQVHLGRVMTLRFDDEAGFRVLDGVRNRTRDDATAYLATLFIAGLRERQGRLDQAEQAYRGAVARFSSGHAAYIGLSEVLQRTGHGDEARTVVQVAATGSLGPTREPLWWYQFEPEGMPEERLETLRRSVRP